MNLRKVRVNNHKETEEGKLYEKMRVLRDRNDDESKRAIQDIVEAIAKVVEIKYKKKCWMKSTE